MTAAELSDLIVETPRSFRLSPRVYTDQAIFEAEMRSIFEGGWVYVSHESEIPRPGDFRTAAVGMTPVIVARGDDNQVRVFMNVCRHRGNAFCRETRGNRNTFRCPITAGCTRIRVN